jgi:hypothetical protein
MIPFNEWIETRHHFSEAKKNAYRLAFETASLNPVATLKNKSLLTKKTFTKAELMFKPVSAPARTICARREEVQCLLAPIIDAMTKAIKHAWLNKFNPHYVGRCPTQDTIIYTSGLDRSQVGQIVSNIVAEGDYHFIASDFSKYDSSQVPEIIRMEMCYYRHLLEGHPLETNLMDIHVKYGAGRWKTIARSWKDGGLVKSSVVGTRSSGDPQTTLCNTILTANLLLYAYVSTYGPEVIEKGLKILVCGDDSFAFLPKCYKYNQSVFDPLKRLGFKLTVEDSEYISELEYCSSFFCRMSDLNLSKTTYYMLPKLGNLLSKSALSVRNYGFRRQCAYACSKARGILNELYMFFGFRRFYSQLVHEFDHFSVGVTCDKIKERFIKTAHKVYVCDETFKDLSFRYGKHPSDISDWIDNFSNFSHDSSDLVDEISKAISFKDLPHYTDEDWREFGEFSQYGFTKFVKSY